MPRINGETTRPSLLAKVRNLSDQSAWTEFVSSYMPLLQGWCRRFRLDSSSADELCQRMLVELMRRMVDYRYDPTGSFRGWLWKLFRFRALNLIKERREELAHLVDLAFLERLTPPYDPMDDEPDERFLARLREAEVIHRAVERRVKPARWQAYLKIAIFGERIGDVAAELGMKYGTAYAAAQYVEGMVREEASKRRTVQTLFP